jgi:hypothetical protein
MSETWAMDTYNNLEWLEVAQTLSDGESGQTLISFTGDSPARTYQWPESGPVLTALVAVSGLSSDGSCLNCGHDGLSSRTFPGFSPVTAELTLPSSSMAWKNSGSGGPTGFWTASTSESRNAAAACSLSQVLQDEVPSKFYLSARAAAGILRRAERRGKMLPQHLRGGAGGRGYNSPRGREDDNLVAHTLKINTEHANGADLETYVMPTLDTHLGDKRWLENQSVIGNYGVMKQAGAGVRRLTPLECERLQGFPDDWTRWTADGREIADSHRYRMMGNAVTVPVAQWIGHRLVAADFMLREPRYPEGIARASRWQGEE